ncbi:MAG: hypothetical protein F6K09_17515 [Merismopedia sp. SIO2A8]|nr:hypothetical protein [Symploca sp. SIO2B6]NET50454.1 hypothetical protein [Merismopedia sp. SIO2A8]
MYLYPKTRKSHTALSTVTLLAKVGLTLGTLGSGIYFGVPHLMAIDPVQAHETGLPWIETKADCEEAGRTWADDVCWDAEHDASF